MGHKEAKLMVAFLMPPLIGTQGVLSGGSGNECSCLEFDPGFRKAFVGNGGRDFKGRPSTRFTVFSAVARIRCLAGVAPLGLRGWAVRLRFLLGLREVSPSAEESSKAPPS